MATQQQHQPMYGWALDSQGKPVPISAAKRGERYFCPVCRGDMVAKQGDVKQHHFAHLNLLQCTPENVARLVAGKWLIEALQTRISRGEAVNVQWKMADGKTQTANILQDVITIVEKLRLGNDEVDLALLDKDNKPKVVILTGIEGQPRPEMITRLNAEQIMVILLNPVGVRTGQIDLQDLMAGATIWGGWWLMDKQQLPPNMIVDPKEIRSLLRLAANKPPYRFYGELRQAGDLSHILDLDGRQLWLPLEVWQNVVGGSRNRMGNDILILSQEWTQDDNSQIALFYVTVRDTTAVAVRYFPPNQPITSQLDSASFRRASVTALDVAAQLVGGKIIYS